MSTAKLITAWNGDIWDKNRKLFLTPKSLAEIWNAYLDNEKIVECYCDNDGTVVLTGKVLCYLQRPLGTASNYQWVYIDSILPDKWRACHVKDQFRKFNKMNVNLTALNTYKDDRD